MLNRPQALTMSYQWHCRASGGIPLTSLASLGRASATSSASSTVFRARLCPLRLPHLAVQQQRYKSAQALRVLPVLSCSLIIHQPKKDQHQQLQQLLLHHSPSTQARHIASTTLTLTHTLSTRELYTAPETNIMGVEIPTEQWAQVVEKVGASKLNPTSNFPSSCGYLTLSL